jgi:hypothetical protein
MGGNGILSAPSGSNLRVLWEGMWVKKMSSPPQRLLPTSFANQKERE